MCVTLGAAVAYYSHRIGILPSHNQRFPAYKRLASPAFKTLCSEHSARVSEDWARRELTFCMIKLPSEAPPRDAPEFPT